MRLCSTDTENIYSMKIKLNQRISRAHIVLIGNSLIRTADQPEISSNRNCSLPSEFREFTSMACQLTLCLHSKNCSVASLFFSLCSPSVARIFKLSTICALPWSDHTVLNTHNEISHFHKRTIKAYCLNWSVTHETCIHMFCFSDPLF